MGKRTFIVPRALQNVFDHLDYKNEKADKEASHEALSNAFQVIVYDTVSPNTRSKGGNASSNLNSNVSNYHYYRARSVESHTDELLLPEYAKSPDEYEMRRKMLFQAIIKKDIDIDQLPQTGQIWNAIKIGGSESRIVNLVSFEREGNLELKFADGAGEAQSAHNLSDEPTRLNGDYETSNNPEEPISQEDKNKIPFSTVDNVFKKFANELPPPGSSIGGVGIDNEGFTKAVESQLTFWSGKKESTSEPQYSMLKTYWDHVGLSEWTPKGVPWSAAFISYQLKSYGLKAAASHYKYTELIITGKTPGWKAYSLSKGKSIISIGDILVKPRGSGEPKDKPYWYSHGDVVYKIESNIAYLAGGNVSDTAKTAAKISLNEDGKANNTHPYIVILKKVS